MKAWIFMKFYTYTHKIKVYHQKDFYEYYPICACARGLNLLMRLSSRLRTFTPCARTQMGESSHFLGGILLSYEHKSKIS